MFDKILASSLDNFMILPNKQITPFPTVTFHIEGQLNDGAFITFEDRNNSELFSHTITAKNGATSTSKEFNPNTNGNMPNFALFDSLRQCQFIYDASIDMDGVITCSLDSSRTYRISAEWTRGTIEIGGTYVNYNSTEMPKSVLSLSGDNFSFSMEKYSPDDTVSFNVTAPFSYTQSKTPIHVRMNGYQALNGSNMPMPLPYSNILILPTTLKKFEVFNESDFYTSRKQNFLCSNKYQTIGFYSSKHLYDTEELSVHNFSDFYMLSIIADDDDSDMTVVNKYNIHQKFFTPSGKLIHETGDGKWYEDQIRWEKVYNNGRIDFTSYLMNFQFIEGYQKDIQIGRIEVYATKNDEKVSDVYTFYPTYGCNRSTLVYFINKYGGVQTADFYNGYEVQSNIEDQEVYFTNPTEIGFTHYANMGDVDYSVRIDEIERVKTKRRNDTYIVKKICDKKEAEWLKELQSSKNVWIGRYEEDKEDGLTQHRWQTIIVDSLDINMSDAQDEYELTLTFHKSDNNLRI